VVEEIEVEEAVDNEVFDLKQEGATLEGEQEEMEF
jgi:hypothetical protein